MGTISFSQQWMNNGGGAVLHSFTSSGSNDIAILPSMSSGAYAAIKLMKGTKPTDFSGLLNPSSRSTDVLATWTGSQLLFTPTVNASGITVDVGASATTASQSGTATWFWAYGFYTTTIYQQFIGDIGAIGSGADCEISTTTITSGQQYTISRIQLYLPSTIQYNI